MPRLSLLSFFIFSVLINAQNNAVTNGEKLVYVASYNMSGILTDLAEVTMETSQVTTSKATLLRLKCTAATYGKWDNFFKIRDLYESYVNPKNLTPYLYNRDINEGSYYQNMKYTYSHSSNSVKSVQKKKKNQVEEKTIAINSGTKDIVSTLYSLRLFDYSNMAIGTSKNLPILFDAEEVRGKITYLGKETIETAIGKKVCYKLAIGTSEPGVLEGKNSNFLWLTADGNKIPVYAKFKIPVGNGELKIKSASGLKN